MDLTDVRENLENVLGELSAELRHLEQMHAGGRGLDLPYYKRIAAIQGQVQGALALLAGVPSERSVPSRRV